MKYLYNNKVLFQENELAVSKNKIYPIVPYIDTPILNVTSKAKVRLGLIDLVHNTEYEQPIQLENITLREMNLFKEHVDFCRDYGTHKFFEIKGQYLSHTSMYGISKYELNDFSIDYFRYENIATFFNVLIPLYNYYIDKRNELDYILFFTLAFCKKEIFNKETEFEHKYPLISKYFLSDVKLKEHYEYVNRVGRDDHAYETTYFIAKSPSLIEFMYLKLLCQHCADKDYSQIVNVSYENEDITLSCCSMYDDNAFRDHTHDISDEICECHKNGLINNHEEIYWNAFKKFKELYLKFKNDNKYLFK